MKTITVTLLVYLILLAKALEEFPEIKFGEIDIENLKMDVYPGDGWAATVEPYEKGYLTIGNLESYPSVTFEIIEVSTALIQEKSYTVKMSAL